MPLITCVKTGPYISFIFRLAPLATSTRVSVLSPALKACVIAGPHASIESRSAPVSSNAMAKSSSLALIAFRRRD